MATVPSNEIIPPLIVAVVMFAAMIGVLFGFNHVIETLNDYFRNHYYAITHLFAGFLLIVSFVLILAVATPGSGRSFLCHVKPTLILHLALVVPAGYLPVPVFFGLLPGLLVIIGICGWLAFKCPRARFFATASEPRSRRWAATVVATMIVAMLGVSGVMFLSIAPFL